MAVTIQALSVSRSVGERLPAQPAPGRVLAVFERSCALTVGDGGEPLSLVPPQIGDGPLNIVVEARPSSFVEIEAGISASVSRARLEAGPLTVDLSGARIWEPRPAWATLRAASWLCPWEEPCLWATKHRHEYPRCQSPTADETSAPVAYWGLLRSQKAPETKSLVIARCPAFGHRSTATSTRGGNPHVDKSGDCFARKRRSLAMTVSLILSGAACHGEVRNDGGEKRDADARPPCWLDAPQERLDQVSAAALRAAPQGSLLDLLVDGVAAPGVAQQPVLRAAREAVPLLAAGWVGDGRALARGAGLLAGLGGGLTPAGDDFLAGLMLRAWLAHPDPEAFCHHLVAAAMPRTTALSAAFLRAAARGECSAAWQALLLVLASAGPSPLDQAVCTVLAHGHTSGADMLAGFLCISIHELLRDT